MHRGGERRIVGDDQDASAVRSGPERGRLSRRGGAYPQNMAHGQAVRALGSASADRNPATASSVRHLRRGAQRRSSPALRAARHHPAAGRRPYPRAGSAPARPHKNAAGGEQVPQARQARRVELQPRAGIHRQDDVETGLVQRFRCHPAATSGGRTTPSNDSARKAEPRGLLGIGAGRDIAETRRRIAPDGRAPGASPRRRSRRVRARATAGPSASARRSRRSASHTRSMPAALAGEACSRCSIIGASAASGLLAGRQREIFGRSSTAAAISASSATRSGASASSRRQTSATRAGRCRRDPPFRSGLGRRAEPLAAGAAAHSARPPSRRDRPGLDEFCDRERNAGIDDAQHRSQRDRGDQRVEQQCLFVPRRARSRERRRGATISAPSRSKPSGAVASLSGAGTRSTRNARSSSDPRGLSSTRRNQQSESSATSAAARRTARYRPTPTGRRSG